MNRDQALDIFLKKANWNTADKIPLAGDASSRTYVRLRKGNESAILMNSPLSERPDQFVFIDRLLEQTGIRVPKILADDLENGFLLLEDFGNNTFTRLLAQGKDELTLYKSGIDTLINLHRNIVLPPEGISTYSSDRLLNGVTLFANWYGKYAVPGGLSEAAISEFRTLWSDLAKQIEQLPQTLVLMDYHADNLMITPDGACGVLDFQDARIGPLTYDLVSLLEDERRDVSPTVRKELINYYFRQCSEWDTPLVRDTLSLVALQRHTRVIGVFVRLFLRDRKGKYLDMIPLIWQQIESHLDEALFKDYRDWLDRYIPKKIRHTPLKPEDFHD